MMRRRGATLLTKIATHEGDSEGDSGFVTPDSTTGCSGGYSKQSSNGATAGSTCSNARQEFRVGEEVLSHSKDGRFYLGNIVEVDEVNYQCLVQFADNTAHWSLFKDIRALRVPDSDELCQVCKSSKATDTNEIVLCTVCEHGYHQNCLHPRISSKYTEQDSEWHCPRCSPPLEKKSGSGRKSTSSPAPQTAPRKARRISKSSNNCNDEEHDNKNRLPYSLSSLSWDPGHKMNQEHTYCYCGGPGEWYNRMLQCNRCRQWFHEACLDSLNYPLLYGDRFYVFVCNLCNGNFGEFVTRLDVRWVDVVHIALFNLTLHDVKTYFDYDQAVTHWIDNNWELLQAPLEMQNVCVEDRKMEVLRVLETNKSRFKCGKEVRKRACMWGLRSRVPPPVPVLRLPSSGPITDEVVRRHSSATPSKATSSNAGTSPPIPRSVRLKDESKPEESSSSPHYSPAKKRAMSPPLQSVLLQQINGQQSTTTATPNTASSSPAPADAASLNNNNNNKNVYHGEGPGKRKRKGELDKLMEDKKAKKMVEEVTIELSKLVESSNCAETSRTTEGDGGRSRQKRGMRQQQQGSGGTNTPPTLRQRADTISSRVKECAHKAGPLGTYHISSPSCSSITEDTSDDTSSHGTLDSFIPPPSNFEGHNNPFLNLELIGSSTSLNNNFTPPTIPPTQQPAAATAATISRPLKRKLSENDIRIGKNGEIKRRRVFRKKKLGASGCGGGFFASSSVVAGYKNGMRVLQPHLQSAGDATNSGSIKNCLDYALSARLGSAGAGKEENDGGGDDDDEDNQAVSGSGGRGGGVTVSGSGGRGVTDSKVSFNDLKSTVNNYFGAANRIANGEKFHVLARRVCQHTGKVQYLIEWECSGPS